MTYPATTAIYAAILAMLFALLSAWVIAGRFSFDIPHMDGGDERMRRRIRAHGNFSEYVPFILILAALLEMGGLPRSALHGLLAPLLAARLMHPAGMLAKVGSLQQFALRGVSAAVTLVILAAAACTLVFRVAMAGG